MSKTAELDVVVDGIVERSIVTYETGPTEQEPHKNLMVREFWKWPEWQAVMKRLHVPPAVTSLTLRLDVNDGVVRLELTTIGSEKCR